ncbi:hypothetical protein F4703DRAFT_1915918 [Phycomyces blakesleeanus]
MDVDVNGVCLYELQQLFSNIKRLNTPQNILCYRLIMPFDDFVDNDVPEGENNAADLRFLRYAASREEEIDWHLWENLDELIIKMTKEDLDIELGDLIMAISFLPCLRKLSCLTTGPVFQRAYTLEDIETIHSYLPHLEHLSLTISIDPLSERDIVEIQKIKPAEKMKSFAIATDCPDASWMHYFSRKYPNLDTLGWYTGGKGERLVDEPEKPTTPPVILPGALSSLRNVTISSTPKEETSPYSLHFCDRSQSCSHKSLSYLDPTI